MYMKYKLDAIKLMLIFSVVLDCSFGCRKDNAKIYLL